MTAPEPVLAAVLAAGASTRFGGDKLLTPWRGKPLGAHIAETIAGIGLLRLAVCPAGNGNRAALFAAQGFTVIDNPDPGRGMGSSLALAARHAATLNAGALLVCLADMPAVAADHLRALLALATEDGIVATAAAGIRTPPVIFGRRHFPALTTLTGDHGAKALLQDAAIVTADPAMVRDIDRRDDL